MDKSKKLMKPLELDKEELCRGIEDIDVEEAKPKTRFPPYIPPRKSAAKVPKNPYFVNFMVSTPLLPENVLFE